MKKLIKVVTIFCLLAIIIAPTQTQANNQVKWNIPLALENSVSSSIVKVEDGIVLMQYEGNASQSSMLIKYDFDGNKKWELKNDYGYYISSLKDGFMIWSESKITKFDKDKNIVWSKIVAADNIRFRERLVEVEDGYIVDGYGNHGWSTFYKMDKAGNITKSITYKDLFGLNDIDIKIANKITEKNEILMFLIARTRDNSDNVSCNVKIMHFNSNLELTEKQEQIISMTQDEFDILIGNTGNINNIIQTDNGYIITGGKTLLFDKNAQLVKSYNKTITDMEKIGDCLYGYVIKEEGNDAIGYYNTFLIKYDQELNEISSTPLELSFYTLYGVGTGFAAIKNRVVYQYDENNIDGIVLNTPISVRTGITSDYSIGELYNDSDKYSITKYRVIDENKTQDNTSSIINNIIKNPSTNSIIIIAVFTVLILIISIVSYIVYKKKKLVK